MADRSDYVEVHDRIQQFTERYPSGSLQSEYDWCDRDGERWLVVKAYAYRDPEDTKPGIGHAWEPVPGRTPYTKGSELMVGETSAWGRALAALGIAVHRGIATGQEIRAAEGRRIERHTPSASEPDAWQTRPPAADTTRRATGKQIQFILNLAKKMHTTHTTEPAKVLDLVNAALKLAELPPVESAATMNDAQARAVIDTFKAAQNSESVARALVVQLDGSKASDQAADLVSDDPVH
jgi:hypothetical protein